MVSFLDLDDIVKKVEIRGEQFELRGLSFADQALLFKEFPEFQLIFEGKAKEEAINQVLLFRLIAWLVAAGLGHAGDEKAFRIAMRLSVDDQFTMAGDVLEMTWPGVVDPFVAALRKAAAAYKKAVSGGKQRSKSPRKSSKN